MDAFNYLRHSGCTSVPTIKDNVEYTNLPVSSLPIFLFFIYHFPYFLVF